MLPHRSVTSAAFYSLFEGILDLIGLEEISCGLPVVKVKLTLYDSCLKCAACSSSLCLTDIFEIAEADGEDLFAHSDAGGGWGAERKRRGKRTERWREKMGEQNRASQTKITLSPPLMTHAPISDWVDYGDSSLCSSQSSLCITFL